ncbi:protein aurora borealis [Zerene cesonia]|uniref:protein aurora borealis n=1 Tax=Zerene cesonia TaxID=33412 RepID=UPI0018E59ADF|nr:protein aurora borealis [Zerene cesonia]
MCDFKNEDLSNTNNKCTPQKKNKVRNPFDKVLVENLHKPICSPGMCKMYKNKSNGSFRWDIDQACTLVPTDIIVCNSQFEPSPDPALEKIAEEATEKFFSQELVLPSPMESSKKLQPLLQATSSDSSSNASSLVKELKFVKTVSVQTTLTLPPTLPPELESILQPFCTFTQEQAMFDEYEVTANGSLRRTLFFEEQSDHDDSEQTDDEVNNEKRPPSSYEEHTPVIFSPDLSCDLSKGMKRTFGTPLQTGSKHKPYRNKILDVVDFEPCFSPIEFRTPKGSATSSSLASSSISPVTKVSDQEKNNFTSPESEAMATCLDCIVTEPESERNGVCFCKTTPNKSILKRSTSLKNSPPKNKRGSLLSEKRSLSMSSLHRSRSVQKLDFSMDMSVDESFHNTSQGSETTSPDRKHVTWSLETETNVKKLAKLDSFKGQSHDIQSSTRINLLDETPIKGKRRTNVAHEISKIRAQATLSPLHMSLDNSLDNFDIPFSMEDKKIDFNTIDLKFLTENVLEYEHNSKNTTKIASESSSSYKKVDSGFNENTFYASSYYESAIKPSELTVTSLSKGNSSKTALKEISNVNWMRVDSGFKDETSTDSTQFYSNESSIKKITINHFSDVKFHDKENELNDDMDRIIPPPTKNDAMSISDFFNEDLTFTCNFSSTPSKNKSRKVNS